MIKAILFDMDGVLVDSEAVSMEVGTAFFRSKGYNADQSIFLSHLGAGEYEFIMGPARDMNWTVSYEEGSAFFHSHYPSVLAKVKAALPGIEVVRSFKKAGFTTAVVSSAPKWKVECNLKAIGLNSSDFDAIFSGESVKRNKPNPDIYLNAAISLGLDPATCLVVEDSLAGIKAGKSASMSVLALLTTENAEAVSSAGADYIISDLSALGEIESVESFNSFLSSGLKGKDEQVRYGANLITPLKRRFPTSEIEKSMIKLASEARKNAYTPFSNFKVGAAILSARTGRIYTGCNVENSSYGATICAERGAVMKALSEEGVIGIDILVVVSDDNPPAPPCALCRQVLSEFSKSDTSVLLVDLKGNIERFRFEELLPHPFIFPTLRA